MQLTLFNTLTRKKEIIKPLKQGEFKIYICGPTIYDTAHIGNLRTYIFEDILVRTLRYFDYRPMSIMNLTDIDDKTIRDSRIAGEDLFDFTEKYRLLFMEDLEKLNIQPADKVVRVTEYIDGMVELIQVLLDKGYAYLADDGSIYYSLEKFKDYGKLSGFDISQLRPGARVSQDEFEKEEAGDFALWKSWNKNDGNNFYEPEFQISDEKVQLKGRPGWHIECSAVNYKEFGSQIDMHCGAVDNIFPHHECEIAQSEAVTGKSFSKYWIHGDHLLVDGKKMAKRFKNYYRLQDIEDMEYTARSFRYLCLQTHYRSQMNLIPENLSGAEAAMKKIDQYVANLQDVEANGKGAANMNFAQEISGYNLAFLEAIIDDLNAAQALAVFWKLHKEKKPESLNSGEASAILDFIDSFVQVLGVELQPVSHGPGANDIPDRIYELAELRLKAREEGKYDESDKLRDIIADHGFEIRDVDDGFEIGKLNGK